MKQRSHCRLSSIAALPLLVATLAGCSHLDFGSHPTFDSWYTGRDDGLQVHELGVKSLDGNFAGPTQLLHPLNGMRSRISGADRAGADGDWPGNRGHHEDSSGNVPGPGDECNGGPGHYRFITRLPMLRKP